MELGFATGVRGVNCSSALALKPALIEIAAHHHWLLEVRGVIDGL
jgi:hypothetical protein